MVLSLSWEIGTRMVRHTLRAFLAPFSLVSVVAIAASAMAQVETAPPPQVEGRSVTALPPVAMKAPM